jgi:hypothetical protein
MERRASPPGHPRRQKKMETEAKEQKTERKKQQKRE